MNRGLLAALCGLSLLFAGDAFAQAAGDAGTFSCSGGVPSGSLYDSGPTCPTTMRFNNIFSFLICNMEQLSSNLLGHMYCGMITALIPAVMAVLTLAVVFFGIGFTTGIVPATAREFQKFLLKTTFVVVFATQAEYLIGYGYNFLVAGARDGVAIALSGMFDKPGATGANVYKFLDQFLGKTLQLATDQVGANKAAGENWCRNAIFAVLAIMAVGFPPLFYISLLLIIKIALTFIRAIFGYIYAIVGIAFLLTLAPFFLSFYLFAPTRQFFDKWISYLISFSLQMVIVFAFLAFVVSIDIKNISGGLTDIIVPVEQTRESSTIRMPWEYCTLCNFEVVDVDTGAVIPEEQYKDTLTKGKLQCKTPVTPILVTDASAPGSGAAPDPEIMNAMLRFAATGLLSLLVLAYMVDAILRWAPSIAQNLASGGGYSPQLAGGPNVKGAPIMDAPGFYEADAGNRAGVFQQFGDNFSQRYARSGNLADSVSDSFSLLVTGRDASGNQVTDAQGNVIDQGLTHSWSNWLMQGGQRRVVE